jgi:multidrug efflux pump subunit AcrB
MFLSSLSIKRPVLATMMMLALVTLGLFSYQHLNIDMYPDVEIPVLTVTTGYEGAAPESVEREVTRKIEEALNPIQGVKHISSTSQEGISSIIVEFTLETRINDAAQEARAKVSAIRSELPKDSDESVIQKLDFSAAPVVSLAVRSDALDARELTTLVDKRVKKRIENVSGVGRVDLVGEAKREVNVWLDPIRLEAVGLTVDEVVAGLHQENVNTPLGRLNRGGYELPVRVSGKPQEVTGYPSMVVAWREGRPIRLGELASVQDGVEERRSLALVNGVPAVALNVLKQSGANTVAVADGVKHSIGALAGEIPAGVTIEVVRDTSKFIRESVEDVQMTLLLGGLLTIIIVFCFLNSWRSTVITGLTLPISVISSFIIMKALGFTLNVMTLMGLSLAIGLLIDDAIVVRENIVRHLKQGKDHHRASLSSRWVDPDMEGKGRRHRLSRLLDRFNQGFERMAESYRKVIAWGLDHRKSVVLLALGSFVAAIFLAPLLGSSFMPKYDRAEFQVDFTTAPEAGIEESQGRLQAILKVLHALPGVELTYGSVGAGETGTVRDGSVYVKLVEKHQRKHTQEQLEALARDGIQWIAGIISGIVEADSMHGGKPITLNLRGDDLEVLQTYSEKMKKIMAAIPGVVDVASSLDQDKPELRLKVDRARAVNVGLSTSQLVNTLGPLVGGKVVAT